MRSTNLAKDADQCSKIAEISLSGENAESSITRACCPIVLKCDTLVHYAPRNFVSFVRASSHNSLDIKVENDWHDVRPPQVAMHRNCHL